LKVVVFGCQQIAVDFIGYINSLEDVDIPLVVTYELPLDKTYGYKSVLEESRALNVNVMNPPRITEKLIDMIKEIKPDIIFSIYYRKIFPKNLITIPRLGCVNVHPSLLPKYRGPVPTAWAIMNGERETGVTIHMIDEGVDTGDILAQRAFEIGEHETGYELYARAMKVGFDLLKERFYDIINQKLSPKKQAGEASFYGKLKSKYTIDWKQRAADIHNLIRTRAKPYNVAESFFFNHYILINKTTILRSDKYTLQGAGKIVDVLDRDRLVISCADGYLILDEYEIVPRLTDIEKDVYIKIGNRLG